MINFIGQNALIFLYVFINSYLLYSYFRIANWKKVDLRCILIVLFFGFPLCLTLGTIVMKSFWRDDEQ